MARARYFEDFAALVDRFAPGGREGVEGFDPVALRALAGDEREEAEAVLVGELHAGTTDPRVARALADLGARGAVPLLGQASQRCDQAGVAAALAVWELAGDAAAGRALADALRRAPDPSARLLAAAELKRVPCPDREVALLAALDDEDELVRGQATETLLGLCGLGRYAAVARSPLFRLTALVLNPLRAVRGPAIRDIAGLIAGFRDGRGPAALGLTTEEQPESAALQRFAESAFAELNADDASDAGEPDDSDGKWAKDLDLESLDQLRGEERRWAEHLVYLVLANGDVRGVRALLHAGDPGAVPALEEVAKTCAGEVAAAARDAAAVLAQRGR